MYLTLTPDENFNNSGLQKDQSEWTCSIPSGLIMQPNTQIALHSAEWKVLEGISIPTGRFTVSIMGHTYQVPITAQTFLEPPAGSSDTAGSLAAEYLNNQFEISLKGGQGFRNWSAGTLTSTGGTKILYPALARFGKNNFPSSTLWEWDNNGKDFVFEMKYTADNDYSTDSTVMVSGSGASINFNSDAYTQVVANDFDTGGGVYRYRMRPANSKVGDAWNDAGFCGFGSAFCTDGEASGGKGKHGELVFKWSDAGGAAQAYIGLATKHFEATLPQTQKHIVAAFELQTGQPPKVKELNRATGNQRGLGISPAPAATQNGDYYRIRMESGNNAEHFTYSVSTDGGTTYTDLTITTSDTDRYVSSDMDDEEIMPCFKPYTKYDGAALYGVDAFECDIVPSYANELGGYKWKWSDYPSDVSFNPEDLRVPFNILGSSGTTGTLKSDGGVVSNANTFASGVYVDIPTLGIKSITAGVERNVVGVLPLGELATGEGGLGSVYGLQFNQVYNMIYHELRNQQVREHNQIRVRLIDVNGNLLTNLDAPAINLCVKPAAI